MKIETKFDIHQRVKIVSTPSKTVGRIVGVQVTPEEGLIYRVAHWELGQRMHTGCYEDELELVDVT